MKCKKFQRVLFAHFLLLVIGPYTLAQEDRGVPLDGKPITVSAADTPREAVESGLGGIVRILVTIDRDGNVTSVQDAVGPGWICKRISRPDVLALRSAAREMARTIKFKTSAAEEILDWVSFNFPSRVDDEKSAKAEADNTASNRPPSNASGTGSPDSFTSPTVSASQGSKMAGGVLNGQALSLPKPLYPSAARAVRASGAVSIQALIEPDGQVFSAQPVSGHPLLRPAATVAACDARFTPTLLSGKPVRVFGIITYNFVP